MTGKNKKELQKENSELKEELNDIKTKYDELSGKLTSLETRMETRNPKCNKCDKTFPNSSTVRNHQVDHSSLNINFKCDQCERKFDEDWKLSAHIKEHAKKKCDRCNKVFKCEDIKKKHIQITHENVKLFCHFFNNEKLCPYEEECIFLHKDSSLCKYGALCERNNCMFKHKKKVEKNIPEKRVIDVHEASDEIAETEIIVDVHQEDVIYEEVSVIVEHVDKIVISDITIETVDDDPQEEIKATNEKTSSKPTQVTSPQIFKCKICDYATKRKGYFNDHKTTSHNWCFICYSTYTCQDDLKNHFKKCHCKALGCLEGKIGKAPR